MIHNIDDVLMIRRLLFGPITLHYVFIVAIIKINWILSIYIVAFSWKFIYWFSSLPLGSRTPDQIYDFSHL